MGMTPTPLKVDENDTVPGEPLSLEVFPLKTDKLKCEMLFQGSVMQ
jgi:hypothetical protein